MRRRVKLGAALIAAILVCAALVSNHPYVTSAQTGSDDDVPGRYIVSLRDEVSPWSRAYQMAYTYGFTVIHVYDTAANGFSAEMTASAKTQLEADPDVVEIIEDFAVFILEDATPTGIHRTEADRNGLADIGSDTNPIAVDVAIIDTGIDTDHPDLNVGGGVSCVWGVSSYEDGHGHGTHVAGIVGALDNGFGAVGVAPGARLWAVRVLNSNGSGSFSDVMCGVEWVAEHADVIDVANMSLGALAPVGDCNDGSLHEAVCTAVTDGVPFVVAAGNKGADASTSVPAAYPETITVSAIVDTDGLPGGLGQASAYYGPDDTLANFSNFGSVVDIAAPGGHIYSTWLNGGYNTISGTSMASPHVAGAAAIYKFQNPGASPDQVRSSLLAAAWPQASANGFSGDSDGFAEPLLNVGPIGGQPLLPTPPPPPPPDLPDPRCELDSASGYVGDQVTISCLEFFPGELAFAYVDDPSSILRGLFTADAEGSGSTSITIPDAAGGEHQVIAVGLTSGIEVSASFTVAPTVSFLSSSGTVGSNIIVYLKGFAASETVDVYWHQDQTTSLLLKSVTTSSTGSALAFVVAQEAPQGAYTIEGVSAASSASASADFTIIPGISLSPPLGTPGKPLSVKLTGYEPGETIDVRWYDAPGSATDLTALTADALGSATTSVTIPEATNGAHLVEGEGSLGSISSATFTTTSGMTFSSTLGQVSAEVAVNLSGFAAGETIVLNWYDTTSTFTEIASVTASATGSATLSFSVPEATGSLHKVEGKGLSSGKNALVFYNVQAAVAITPESGEPGTEITVNLSGFPANDATVVEWFDTQFTSHVITSMTTSSFGSATGTFLVPADAMTGPHTVQGKASAGYPRASKTFTVASAGGNPNPDPDCDLNVSSGPVGSPVTVTCSNFGPSELVRIYIDSTSSTMRSLFVTGSNGSGSATFNIPNLTGGPHVVIARGDSNGDEILMDFTVEAGIKFPTTSGKVGDYVVATLSGFAASEAVNVIWHHSATSSTVVTTVTASATGNGSAFFQIPAAASSDYTVEAVGVSSGVSASATFSVVPGVSLSTTFGNVGSSLTISAKGFGAGEQIDIVWHDDASTSTVITTVTASSLGAASTTTTVPEATGGNHVVQAVGSSGASATATFTVSGDIALSTTLGTVGTNLTVTLTGFGSGETVNLNWYHTTTSSVQFGSAVTSNRGSATVQVTVPDAIYGLHKVEAVGQTSGKADSVFFNLNASIILHETSGPTGGDLTVTVTGFRANDAVAIRWYDTMFTSFGIATAQADAFGTGTVTFTVPAGATPGVHKVEGVSGLGFPKVTANFTVN